MTLTTFLLDRIAEDEAAAQAATRLGSPPLWAADRDEVYEVYGALDSPHRCTEHPRGLPNMCDDERVASIEASDDAEALIEGRAAHIARHDPARVLAQCAAYRQIVAEHGPHDQFDWLCRTCSAGDSCGCLNGPHAPCPTLRALASIWAGHPAYEGGWAL